MPAVRPPRALAAAGPLLACALAAAPSHADVAADGSFATEVAIEVPALRGTAPSIGLRYTSTGGNGVAGVGWTLDAGSTIVRTGLRGGIPSDGYSPDDHFLLDGRELVPCAAGSTSPSCTSAIEWLGSSAGFYSTERESFLRIQHVGAGADFTIWTTGGERATYVTRDGGKTWVLEQTVDNHGNTVDHSYTCAPGFECELQAIHWGDSPTFPRAEVRFYYEPRPDLLHRATGGGFVVGARRLRSITVSMGGSLARAYALGYVTSPTSGRSLLRSVQQFGRDAVVNTTSDPGRITAGATPPLPATLYSAESGGSGWRTTAGLGPVPSALFSTVDLPGVSPAGPRYPAIQIKTPNVDPDNDEVVLPTATTIGDFDGDGRIDVAFANVNQLCRRIAMSGVLARNGAPFEIAETTPIDHVAPYADCTPAVWTADVDGDHDDDLLVRFHNRLFTARLSSGKFRELGTGYAWSGSTRNCGIADVDGDQRSDLVCLDGGKVLTLRSRGNGGFLSSTTALSGTYAADTPMALGDFNADGFADVALAPVAGGKRAIVTLTSLGAGTYAVATQSTGWVPESDHALRTADVDGDGAADLVLVRRNAAGGGGLALSVKGHGGADRFAVTAFAVPFKDAVAGDVDGDGRTDLVSTDTFEASIATGGGFYAAPTAGWPAPGACASRFVGDTDGDGRTDLICVRTIAATPTTPRLSEVRDLAPFAPLRDPHKWISADLDGDGQSDYAYVFARNPGVGVLTILTSGAAPHRVTWTLAPSAAIPGLTDPAANRWLAADVGGPSGAPDGNTDLVLVDTDGTSLRVYTLLSKGDGTYEPRADQPWRDAAGNLLAFPEADLGNFFPIDLDSDGRDDLIRLSAQSSAAQVSALISRGDGRWTRGVATYAFPGGAPLASPTDLRPIDLNGDGLLDLVHTQTGVGISGTEVRALLNRGDGSFTPLRSTLAMTFADVARWMLLDANGDGLTDLVHVESTVTATGSGIAFQPVLSRGDGTFVVETATTAWLDAAADPALAKSLEGSAFLYPTDLDGDARTDLLALSRYRDAAGAMRTLIVQLRNPGLGGSSWTVSAYTPGAALPAAAAWAWRPTRDSDRPSSSALAHVDPAVGAAVFYDHPSDRLVRIDNGTGGLTDVAYRPLLGHRTYLPSGTLPVVTDAVTRTDLAYLPAAVEQVTYGYDGARWSDADRRMIGYAAIGARDPRRYVVTNYTTDDACPNRVEHVATYDAVTHEAYSYTDNLFVAPGGAPGVGPYTCLLQQQSQYGCDGGSCRRESLAELTYDGFGNVVTRVDTAVDAPTRVTFTPVIPNLVDYVVDLPQYRKIQQQDAGAPTVLSDTVFLYDDNAGSGQPPAATAELTRIQAWDDVDGVYRTTVLDYDAHGMLTSSTTPGGVTTTTIYDPTYGSFPWVVCDPIGCKTTSWDMGLGVPVITWDYNGHGALTARDAHGRIHQVTGADGSVVRHRLLGHGEVGGSFATRQRLRTELVDGSPGDGVLWSEQLLDGTGRVYRTVREGGATTVIEYDGLSQRVARTSLPFPHTGAPAYWNAMTYDPLGRPRLATNADGSTRAWIYTLGEVTATDEHGHPRSLVLDGTGAVIRVTEHAGGTDHRTAYGYDALGRLVVTVDAAGYVTRYDFDMLGRLRSEVSPDRGHRSYRYTADGALWRSVDAKDQVIELAYDAAGRPQTRTDVAGAGDAERQVTWTYDAIDGVPQGASAGRLVKVEELVSGTELATTFRYDAAGRITHEQRCIDATCMELGRSYDLAGRLDTLSYPDATGALAGGEAVVHRYDATGRLVGVGDYVTDIDYALDGRIDAIRAGNGVRTAYVRDPARRWADDLSVTDGAPLYRAHYEHDLTGRITFVEEAAPTNTGTFDYDFDDLGRLEQVTASDPALDRSYGFDAIGRMTYHSQHGAYYYDDPAHPHGMTSTDAGSTRRYDANGNVDRLSDPSGRNFKLAWSVMDRPTVIGPYDMTYDVGGARVKKTGPTTGLYFGDLVAIEDGQLVTYHYAGSRLIARNDGKPYYYHQDHTNSPRLVTDKDGAVVSSYQYEAFGAPVVETEAFADPIGYLGLQGDQDLGLVYLGARYYDPTSARFLSADSVVRDAYAPQSLDRYAYVEGDPVNYWDPSGHLRSDIELMKERKQQWRSLMVAYEEALNGGCASVYWCESETTAMIAYAPDGKTSLVRVAVGTDPASLRFDLTPTPDWPGAGPGSSSGGGDGDWNELDGPLAPGGPMIASADGGVYDAPSGGIPDSSGKTTTGDGPQQIGDNNPLPGQDSDTGGAGGGPVIVEVNPAQLKPGMNHITNVVLPGVTATLDVQIGANGKVIGTPTITADGDTSTPNPKTKLKANEVSATITSTRERTVTGKQGVTGSQSTGTSNTAEVNLGIEVGVVTAGGSGSSNRTQNAERGMSLERGGEYKASTPSRRVIFQLPQSAVPKPPPPKNPNEPRYIWAPDWRQHRRDK
jgi:RHS repeat-associated protein